MRRTAGQSGARRGERPRRCRGCPRRRAARRWSRAPRRPAPTRRSAPQARRRGRGSRDIPPADAAGGRAPALRRRGAIGRVDPEAEERIAVRTRRRDRPGWRRTRTETHRASGRIRCAPRSSGVSRPASCHDWTCAAHFAQIVVRQRVDDRERVRGRCRFMPRVVAVTVGRGVRALAVDHHRLQTLSEDGAEIAFERGNDVRESA